MHDKSRGVFKCIILYFFVTEIELNSQRDTMIHSKFVIFTQHLTVKQVALVILKLTVITLIHTNNYIKIKRQQ